MGLHGPHPRDTGLPTPGSVAEQPVSEGLQKIAWQVVRQTGYRRNRCLLGTLGLFLFLLSSLVFKDREREDRLCAITLGGVMPKKSAYLF